MFTHVEALVGGIDHEGVLQQSGFAEVIQRASDVVVERLEHLGVVTHVALIFIVRQSFTREVFAIEVAGHGVVEVIVGLEVCAVEAANHAEIVLGEAGLHARAIHLGVIDQVHVVVGSDAHLLSLSGSASGIVIVEGGGLGEGFVLIFIQILQLRQPAAMARLVVDEECEGSVLVALVVKPVDGFVGDDVGDVAAFSHRVVRHGDEVGIVVVSLFRHDVPVVKTGGKADEVPFSDDGSLIARFLEEFGHGLLRAVEDAVFVVGESVFVGVLAGEHAGSGGSGERVGDVGVDELDSVGSDAVKVGRADVGFVVAAHHLRGVVIGHDIDDVVAFLSSHERGEQRRSEKQRFSGSGEGSVSHFVKFWRREKRDGGRKTEKSGMTPALWVGMSVPLFFRVGILLLRHVIDDVHDLFAECVSFFHGVSFGIDADDGFGVTLAEVHPLVSKVNLDAVDVSDGFVLIEFLDLLQDGEDVGGGIEVDAVLGDEIFRERIAELGGTHSGLSQMSEDEGDAHECVATGVSGGIDDTTVSFATDDGTCFFHLGHHVHFADGCSSVVATIFLGDVTQTAGGREVGHRGAGGVLEHVVGASHEGVFFTEHGAIFANEGEAVHIGIDHDAEVVTSLAQEVTDFGEVFFERFGVVGEVSGGFHVETGDLSDTQLSEEFRQDDAADGVHGVDGDGEVSTTDGVDVHEFEVFDEFDVTLVVAEVLGVASEAVHVCKFKVAAVGEAHHFRSLYGREEFTFFVEEFEGVPLARVVAGSDDDAAAGAFHGDGELGGRGGSKADVHHVKAHAHECAADHVADHFTADASITTHHNLAAEGAVDDFLTKRGISRNGLGNVHGVERVACATADGAAETGNGFN